MGLGVSLVVQYHQFYPPDLMSVSNPKEGTRGEETEIGKSFLSTDVLVPLALSEAQRRRKLHEAAGAGSVERAPKVCRPFGYAHDS